jgi:hypothetical protein
MDNIPANGIYTMSGNHPENTKIPGSAKVKKSAL